MEHSFPNWFRMHSTNYLLVVSQNTKLSMLSLVTTPILMYSNDNVRRNSMLSIFVLLSQNKTASAYWAACVHKSDNHYTSNSNSSQADRL